MPSRLQDVINQYRQRLLDHERTAMAALDYAHRQTLAMIEPQLDILYKAMSMKLQADQSIPLEWLYENKRLQAITQWIEGQIDHFGALTQMQVGQLQHFGVQLGQQAGMASLNSTVPSGVNWSFGVPSPKAIADLVGATQAGSPLYDLFQGFGAEAAQGAKDALITGVTLGYNPRDIAPLVQDALDISRWRALTIARTEMLRSYRGANLETFRANSDVVQGWIWQSALDRGTCAACIAMNGTEHDLSEEMASHVNCRCVQVPKTKGWDDILGPLGIDTTGLEDTSPDIIDGSDWFSRQSEETQRAILGNAKYDAYADGQFQLSDVVGTSHSEDWGSSIYERSLKDTLEAAGSAPAAVEEAPKLTPEEQRIQALEDSMNAKYPDILFDLAGSHPDVMEPAMKQLDDLMTKYPDVAKVIPYVGTGANLPEDLSNRGYKAPSGNVDNFAYVYHGLDSGGGAYVPLFMNNAFFANPDLFNNTMNEAAKVGWLAFPGGDNGVQYTITHEFGHILNFFLLDNGKGQSFVDFISSVSGVGDISFAMSTFMDVNRGKYVSEYSKTNDREQFAEGFAALNFLPKSQWDIYSRRLYGFLQYVIPDGSTDGWTQPTPQRAWPSEEAFQIWEDFVNVYSGKKRYTKPKT